MRFDAIIIGAGLSGIAAASELKRLGWGNMLVLEKSRGLGGRMSSRRVEGQPIDIGAQFFTVRSGEFNVYVQRMLAKGSVALWKRPLQIWDGVRLREDISGEHKYICPEGMNTLVKSLAPEDLAVELNSKVSSVSRVGRVWLIQLEDGRSWEAEKLISTIPLPQALTLLGSHLPKPVIDRLQAHNNFHACLCTVCIYDELDALELTGVQVESDSGSGLMWLANDSSKRKAPERAVLVMHADAAFSAKHWDDEEKVIELRMLEEAKAIIPELNYKRPKSTFSKRWKLARIAEPLNEDFIVSPERDLFLAGDWCFGMRVEAAFGSGIAVARALGV